MKKLFLICTCLCLAGIAFSQQLDSTLNKITRFPNNLFSKIQNKTVDLDRALVKQTEKYLARMAKKEKKLERKLYRKDSAAAKSLFAGSQEKYLYLERQMKAASGKGKPLSGEYLPYIDSLKGSLSFLQQNQKLLNAAPELQNKISGSLAGFNQLQSRLEISEQVRQFIQQRKTQLRNTFSQYANSLGVNKYLDAYNKQAYYYTQQVKEYKEMLNDPDKLEKKALSVLTKLPAFQEFMKKNSMLAGLFNIPGGSAGMTQPVQGLPSREQVMSAIQGQIGAAVPNPTSMVQQSLQSAEGQLDQLRKKLSAFGSNGGDIDVPDFRPNNQKTKSFLKRLEYGTNLQTAHGNFYFPTTSDLGLSVGYKLNDKNIIGIGASYKIGWGSDISHIKLSSQGAGLRSFIDMQLIKTFFASGGFEYNYQQPFNSLNAVSNLSSWQQSGLVGVSKIISLKTKLFKKTKIQLLWDFLSYQQVPRTQALKFRVGYNF